MNKNKVRRLKWIIVKHKRRFFFFFCILSYLIKILWVLLKKITALWDDQIKIMQKRKKIF